MIATLLVLAGVTPVLWLVPLVPVIALATFTTLLLAYQPPATAYPWQESERHLDPRPAGWKPAHRATSARPPAGRHQPRWGSRHVPVRTRVGEETVSINPAAILSEGLPDADREGFDSW